MNNDDICLSWHDLAHVNSSSKNRMVIVVNGMMMLGHLQMSAGEENGDVVGAREAIAHIVQETAPDARYERYHESWLLGLNKQRTDATPGYTHAMFRSWLNNDGMLKQCSRNGLFLTFIAVCIGYHDS
jgi:hypothetical protein